VQNALTHHQQIRLPEPFYSCLKTIFGAVSTLKSFHEGHQPPLGFSPGDRLVGDTGEALAKLIFNLEPLRNGETRGHDYWSPDLKKKVQVKTTARDKLSLLGRSHTPFEQIIAFKLYPNGSFEVLFNGPGSELLATVSSASVALSTLRRLHASTPDNERVPFRSPLPDFADVDS
jgi:hypothetical protein